MTSNIILTSRNIVANTNNTVLVYKFPNSVQFDNHEIAVSSLQMYYSWQNINSATLRNNTLSYVWETNVAGVNVPVTYPIVIPAGLYEIGDINFFCQFTMITNGHYFVNASGQNVYFFEWIVNPTIYAIQLNTFQVPTVLPAGWTNPSGVVLPFQTFKPQVATPANFNLIVGFADTFVSDRDLGVAYPATDSYTSTITPQVQPNPTLLVTSSNIDNKYASPSSVIYSVTPVVAIGEQIIEKPPEFSWNKMLRGTYAELRVTFTGSDNSPIIILDPNMTMILAIRERAAPSNK
jgi:hypothetical protein